MTATEKLEKRVRPKIKITLLIRCLIPTCLGSLFILSALHRINSEGVHLLPLLFCFIGAFAIAVGIYYAICRLEVCDGGFIAQPGNRRYRVDDVMSWKLGENHGAEPGHRRYLELGFDKWYRHYMLFEEDVSSLVFDEVLRSLRERKNT